MLNEYINSLRTTLKWYICYHKMYSEEFIPAYRNYYEQLQKYPKSIPSQYLESFTDYTINAYFYLLNCELYAIEYGSFIRTCGIYINDITKQYDCLFKKI